MAEYLIRRATHDDVAALAHIGRTTFIETFGHLYPPRDLEVFLPQAYGLVSTRESLSSPGSAAWLVEQESQVVGFATVGLCTLPHPEVGTESFELKRFYLLKTQQNSGIGGRLFRVVMDWILAQQPADLWIGVWSRNHGALRFYARHGFERVGEYGFQVGDTVDDEFILKRTPRSFPRETR